MKRVLGHLRRRWWLIAILIPGLIICGFFSAILWWPYPTRVDASPACSTLVIDKDGTPLAAFAGASGYWFLPLQENQISPNLLKAMVAVEDSRFYQHGGIDWSSVAGASWQDVQTFSLHRGASTIDMQLYRLRDPAQRSLCAKVVQAIRSCQIDRRESKQQILVEYVNLAPFGGNLRGAGAASWRYFGRPCSELSLGQAALLAGLPQSPNRFRPDRYPERAKTRRSHVLERMAALGMITAQQQSAANSEPVNAKWGALPQDALGDIGLLPTLLTMDRSISTGTIHTTIDLPLQQQASVMTRDALADFSASHIGAAAVVVLDTASAHVLAQVSEIGDGTSQIDLTRCLRSSGSTLKPFIYAAGFTGGICTPKTLLKDSPASWEGYEPENYDRGFRGLLPASDALAESRNVPAISLLSKIGCDEAVGVMRSAGLIELSKKPERYGLSLAIGGAEISPMELAEAYATLARGGTHCTATNILIAVEEKSGSTRLKRKACRDVMYCLADIERTRNVFLPAANLAPAWKTGTSSGHRDAWCAAVTPRRTVIVWMGNVDGSGSDQLVGSQVAAPLALKILVAADRTGDALVDNFAPPAGFSNRSSVELKSESATLTMVYPREGQQIVCDSTVSTQQQKIGLRAGGEDGPVWWFVDGQCVGQSNAREGFWWQPSPGRHEVLVSDATGHSSRTHFSVN